VPEQDVRRKLAWLIGSRVGITTVLLGSAIAAQITAPGALPIDPFFFLIGLTYALAIVWSLTIKPAVRHRWIVDVQLACDALIVSAFIYVTGGITSYFSSLYILPVIAASMFQFRRGGMLVAILSTVIYGGLVLAQYFSAAGWVSLPGLTPVGDVLALPPIRMAGYTFATNVFGFFAVAFLSGSLAEGLRKAGARLERASSEIADWQAFNQHVIDSLTSGLATTDTNGRVLTFNRAAEAICGQSALSVIGRRIEDVLQIPSVASETPGGPEAGPRSRRLEIPYRMPGGRLIDIGYSAAPLQTPGGLGGSLYTFQDVTEIKKLERDARLRQRLAAVGEMAAGIAHEIRNPLASISGSIQILRQELPLSDEQAQLMDIVLRESERLNNTIRSFLAYARPQRFAIARLDLGRVLNDAALLLRHSSEVHEGHVIDVDVPPGEVGYEADEGQIRQIVWNLATNGLRAMHHGGRLRLSARLEPSADGAGEGVAVLSVADEGVGIAPEDLDNVFQPFHGSFAKGSGLGLSIVHRIVSDYNGEIRVSSTPGAGTTVNVRLPVRQTAVIASQRATPEGDRT
jgi:two-component system, NtrC family, sensor histidine kinase PilS